jgi:biopolymer transport protein ExbD
MGRRKRNRNKGDAAELEMTPMIDVVFQLLIFFIVTLKEEDILAKLNVARPAPDPNTTPETQVDDLLTIVVGPKGYSLNGRAYQGPSGLKALDSHLSKVASYDRGTTLVIKCTGDSQHKYLIQLLNICAREQLSNLSVFSM